MKLRVLDGADVWGVAAAQLAAGGRAGYAGEPQADHRERRQVAEAPAGYCAQHMI
jgi:hypothetical protein